MKIKRITMKGLKRLHNPLGVREGFVVVAVMALLGGAAYVAPASGQSGAEAAPTYDITLPQGYRDWPLISIARVGGPVNDMRAKLGNNVAMRTFWVNLILRQNAP
jgi:hypothetical protein